MKLATLAAVALLAIANAAVAAAPAPVGVKVEHAWIRWLPANLPNAGYVEIVNDGATASSLVGVSTPDYADATLMQSHLAEDDSSMVAVTHIDVPAHGSARLTPGGYHIMLAHATKPIKPGDTVPMTLHFADGSRLQADFPVLPASASGPAD